VVDSRFNPKHLNEMLVEYLAVVRPVEIFLSHKFNCNGAADLEEFMWADYNKGLWTGDFISDLLKRTTSSHEMHGLGFREYRQVATAFMEENLKYKARDPDNVNVNAIVDLQAGHNSRTAGVSYAVSTEDHSQVSREAMYQYDMSSTEWYELMLGPDSTTTEQEIPTITENNQAIKGSPVQLRTAMDPSMIRPQSIINDVAPRRNEGMPGSEVSGRALQALRGLYDDEKAQFKSRKQAEAVRLALERKTDLLVILPTGGGKSVVFMAPAWYETQKTTVVIVPFVALIEEMQDRCKEQNLSCYIWKNSNVILSQRMAQVILVSVNHAVTPEFRQFLIRLEEAERLSRIVIDECHVLLTQRSFRPEMRRVTGTVRCVCVPVILLTATMPIGLEQTLRASMGCESLRVVRKRSERNELYYRVMTLAEGSKRADLDKKVSEIVRKRVEHLKKDERIIVYCLQRKWAEELTRLINAEAGRELCGTYHADMEREDRQDAYKDWREGVIKCLVATSALGAGINHAGVRLVIHHGHGKSMIDQCQEMGRAGRDGERAICLTVFWEGITEETEWIEKEEREEVLRWVRAEGCRRELIGLYLDGEGTNCLALGKAEPCDNCERVMRDIEREKGFVSRPNCMQGNQSTP
jgi:RecQ family ATP-dependent DNA helicase